MDFATLTERVQASRRLQVQTPALPRAEFAVVLPTRHAYRLDLMQQMAQGVSVAAASVAAERVMLARALVGWSGVQLSDIDSSIDHADDAPLAHTPEAVALLLDERPDVAVQLAERISTQMRERDQRFEAAEKNSGSASRGNETGARRSN